MRDDDARGTWRPSTNAADPHLEFAVKFRRREEGRIPHSFAPPLAYVFGLDVHGLLFFFTSLYVCAADGA